MADLNLSCPDWADRIRAGRSLIPAGLPVDPKERDRAIGIYNMLRLPDVPGMPMLAEAGGDWFREIVGVMMGAFDVRTGERLIREAFVLVPKKNSKTTNGAAFMIVAMLMSRRPRAEFVLVAPTQEVSDVAFSQAVGMILADPVLKMRCMISEHLKKIVYRPTGAFLKVKTFDTRVVTGSKPAGILLDETHVIAENHNADRVVGQLRGGLISQPEGFLMQITTQSERAPAGVFAAELRKARAVRDGRLKAPILPVLYEFPDGVDWRDRESWPMVLPNVGRSLSVERLSAELTAAEVAGDEELRRWASQHLNVQIGLALVGDGWIGARFWEEREVDLTLDALLDRSDVVTVGIDGGGMDDLFALTVIGRDAGSGDWMVWSRSWIHPIAKERRLSEAQRYADFERDGDLVTVIRVGDDIEQCVEIVSRCEESGLLDKVGLDPIGIGAVAEALEGIGIEADRLVGIPQGWKLAGAIKTMERKLAEGAIRVARSALLRWAVGNARVEQRGNAILITKQAAGVAKIDPLVATFNAAALMSLCPEGPGTVTEDLMVIA